MKKKRTFKEKFYDAKEDAKCWAYNHQEDLYKAAYIAASIGSVIAPIVVKVIRDKRKAVRYYADHRVWDPSLQMYWETKKLTNNKKLIIAERRQNGEPLSKILKDMKVLK